jgi:hypothetical protein
VAISHGLGGQDGRLPQHCSERASIVIRFLESQVVSVLALTPLDPTSIMKMALYYHEDGACFVGRHVQDMIRFETTALAPNKRAMCFRAILPINITNTEVQNRMTAVERFSGAIKRHVTIIGIRIGIKASLKSDI